MHRMFLAPVSFLLTAFLLASQPANPNIQPSVATTAQTNQNIQSGVIAAPTDLITG